MQQQRRVPPKANRRTGTPSPRRKHSHSQKNTRNTQKKSPKKEGVRGRITVVIIIILGLLVTVVSAHIIRTARPEGTAVTHTRRISTHRPTNPPLTYTDFSPGNIISDKEFYDSSSMDAGQVNDFIATWNKGCRATRKGVPCLTDFREKTPTIAPDRYCTKAYNGAENERAGDIIAKVAQACGINPKVLLVLVQKEQGLITASDEGLVPSKYASATGFGCPDGGKCSSVYAGFFKQVYYAARQFQIYTVEPERFAIIAEADNDISFNVDDDCGSDILHIENQATANLYNYTPYQPDKLAIEGQGGECSTWGNLNFWAYYRAWFASAQQR